MFRCLKPLRQVAVAALALAATNTAPSAQDVSYQTVAVIAGIAMARDGDDVRFGDVRVRLRGIATPEHNSRNTELGGPEASANLAELVNGKYVICHLDGSQTRGRPVGVCFVDGVEINRSQVRDGVALDCPRFSSGRYSADQAAARADGSDLAVIYPLPSYCNE